ncbi:MAG TPA: hypothetical protein VH497_22030 [Vicinamibacterales bacterium]
MRRAVAFVAIVWGIAATFVAFEVVSLSGMDFALSHPGVFGNVLLSPAVTRSTSCVVTPAEQAAAQPGGPGNSAGVGAWSLGVGFGRDAVLRQYVGADTQALDAMSAGLAGLAGRLGVPPPVMFRPVQLANANTEFVLFLEQDSSGTAHRFATAHAPRACELFKLGAVWGYSEMVRPALPGERAVFAMEIRYYAARASVPEELWNAMLQRLPADAGRDQVMSEMAALTNGVTTYLSSH